MNRQFSPNGPQLFHNDSKGGRSVRSIVSGHEIFIRLYGRSKHEGELSCWVHLTSLAAELRQKLGHGLAEDVLLRRTLCRCSPIRFAPRYSAIFATSLSLYTLTPMYSHISKWFQLRLLLLLLFSLSRHCLSCHEDTVLQNYYHLIIVLECYLYEWKFFNTRQTASRGWF